MLASRTARNTRLWRTLLIGAALLLLGTEIALLPTRWMALGLAAIAWITLSVVQPDLPLYAIAFAIPFGSLFEVSLGGITVGVTEGLVGLLIVAWAAQRAARLRGPVRWPKLALPLAAFVLVAGFSLLSARSLTLAFKELIKWLEVLLVVVIVYNGATLAHGRGILACLLLAAAAQALLGVYQFLTASGPESFALFGRYVRAYGTFEQPNPFGGYLGLTAPLALSLALGLLASRRTTRRVPHAPPERSIAWLALAVLPLLAAGIGMSWSRGAWLGLGAAALSVAALQSRRWAIISVCAVVLVVLATVAGAVPDLVLGRLTSFVPFVGVSDISAIEVTEANYASLERLAHWQSALDMWRDHPWAGIGFGNYDAAYAQYALPKWPYAMGHAHNYYLNIAAETGLPGLVAYLALWATALLQTWRAARRAQSVHIRALALGALGMVVHLSVHNVVDNLWVHNMYLHVAIVLGLVQASAPVRATRFAPAAPSALPPS
ncbi:MAG: O-antigen ligase family protein [Anaerolineae bacterium]|nr:O-antigen ligase family protein [Anaerolineae bacterium]